MNLFTKIDERMGKIALLITALIATLTFSFGNQLITMAQPSDGRWAGMITDENGEPLNATVAINGVQVETDDDGRFELDVSPAEDRRYVINVEKLGYVPISKIHIGTAIGQLDLTLQQAQRFDIEPQEPINIEDKRGTQIIIEPGSLVDARGNPAERPLQLLMYTYDLASEEMVGNMSGINRDGRLVSMVSFGAFYADFIDEEGNAYNLAEGAEATIVVPANQTVEFPDVVPLWSYNMEEGLWIEEGEGAICGRCQPLLCLEF